jgi:hypothetical protein
MKLKVCAFIWDMRHSNKTLAVRIVEGCYLVGSLLVFHEGKKFSMYFLSVLSWCLETINVTVFHVNINYDK